MTPSTTCTHTACVGRYALQRGLFSVRRCLGNDCSMGRFYFSWLPLSVVESIVHFAVSFLSFQMKSIYVSVDDSSRDCIRTALKALDLLGTDQKDTDFQLWVRTKFDEAPYPLIGHELPLVIKLHWTRQAFNSRNQKSYDEYKAGCRCSFILRSVQALPKADRPH